MMSLIRIGDDTNHGGKVETGSNTMRFDGCYAERGYTLSACNPSILGRSERIRTFDPLIPNQMRYQAALRSDESKILSAI